MGVHAVHTLTTKFAKGATGSNKAIMLVDVSPLVGLQW